MFSIVEARKNGQSHLLKGTLGETSHKYARKVKLKISLNLPSGPLKIRESGV